MVMVHPAGANVSLPSLTIFLATPAKSIGVFGLVYQSLPGLHSGSNLRVCGLYQTLPPRTGTEYYVGLELVVGGAVDEGDVVPFFIG